MRWLQIHFSRAIHSFIALSIRCVTSIILSRNMSTHTHARTRPHTHANIVSRRWHFHHQNVLHLRLSECVFVKWCFACQFTPAEIDCWFSYWRAFIELNFDSVCPVVCTTIKTQKMSANNGIIDLLLFGNKTIFFPWYHKYKLIDFYMNHVNQISDSTRVCEIFFVYQTHDSHCLAYVVWCSMIKGITTWHCHDDTGVN